MATVTGPVRCMMYSQNGNQAGINVWHFSTSVIVGTGATLQQMADTFAGAIGADYKALMGEDTQWHGLEMYDLGNTTSGPAVSTTGAGAGFASGDTLPRAVAGLIRWNTGFRGRAFRGRSYLPFPTEAFNGTTGEPNAGYITALTTLVTDLIGFQTTVVGTTGNTSYLLFSLLHAGTTFTREITSGTPRPSWGTQHRRGDYGRANTPPF